MKRFTKVFGLFVVLAILAGLLAPATAIAQGPEPSQPQPFEVGEGEGSVGSRVDIGMLGIQSLGSPTDSDAVMPFDSALDAPSGNRPTTSAGGIGIMSATPPSGLGIAAGANWLLDQQDVSGGWPWTPGGAVTQNTNGPSGRGMLKAYEHDGDQRYLDSAIATGDFLVPVYPRLFTDGDPRIATHDPLFLEELSLVSGDTSYATFVQTYFWDKLTSGTYGETNDMDALEFGLYVVSARNGQSIVELSPWDLSATAIAAHIAGEGASRDALMQAIQTGLEATTNPGGYDVIGLAGAVWASSVTGIDLDPTTGVYASANSTADLVDILLGMTMNPSIAPWADGAWLYDSTLDPTDFANADTQTSAYAMLALEAHDRAGHITQLAHGASFMRSLQDPGTSQFLTYPGAPLDSTGSVEVNGEVLSALTTVAPSETWVDDDWVSTSFGADPDGAGPALSFGYDAFASAQLGVDGVGQSTVWLAPGIYEEQVEIMKNDLEIIGTGATANEVVIRSPLTLPLYFTTSKDNYPIVFVHGAENVRLQNLTVDGAGRGNGNYRFVGVAYLNASGVVENTHILDIRETPASGTQHGVGIYAYNGDSQPRELGVFGNYIQGHQKNAMALAGTGLTVHVDGNEVVGFGPVGFIAENGIQVSAGATGEVTSNTISGHWYTGPNWTSSGLLAYSPGPGLQIANNQSSGDQTAIYGYTMADPGIFDNQIDDANWGIINYLGTNVEVGGNRISDSAYGLYSGDGTGNHFGGNRVEGGDIGFSTDGLESAVTVDGSIFIGQAEDAILFEPYEADEPSGQAHVNVLCGFGNLGLENTTANHVSAEDNYWGHEPPAVVDVDYTGDVGVDPALGINLDVPATLTVGETVVVTASLQNLWGDGVGDFGVDLQTTAGALDQPSPVTVWPNGVVTGTLTAPTTTGAVTLSAVPECGVPVEQVVNVKPGAPATIEITQPLNDANLCFADPYSVTIKVSDGFGNAVVGEDASLYASSGDLSTLDGLPVVVTCVADSAGECSFNWVPETLGAQHLLATSREAVSERIDVTVAICGTGATETYLPIIMK